MKKYFYISCAVVFWILLGFILHIIIEVSTISLLLNNFERYGLGLSWAQLMTIHYVFTFVLFLASIVVGVIAGLKWWKFIYIDKKYRGRFFKIKD